MIEFYLITISLIFVLKHIISDKLRNKLYTAIFITTYTCVTFFGYYIWLQSDAAFYYLRLDKCSFTVGMFCATCDVTRRPLGRLATACSWEGKCVSTRRAGPRGVSLSQVFDETRPIADIWEIPLKLIWTLLTDDLALHNGNLLYD